MYLYVTMRIRGEEFKTACLNHCFRYIHVMKYLRLPFVEIFVNAVFRYLGSGPQAEYIDKSR